MPVPWGYWVKANLSLIFIIQNYWTLNGLFPSVNLILLLTCFVVTGCTHSFCPSQVAFSCFWYGIYNYPQCMQPDNFHWHARQKCLICFNVIIFNQDRLGHSRNHPSPPPYKKQFFLTFPPDGRNFLCGRSVDFFCNDCTIEYRQSCIEI
jgi:hypothetical protein